MLIDFLRIIRNAFLMWCITLGFLVLMTYIECRIRANTVVVWIMISSAYILGGITGGLFSKTIWIAALSGVTFIGSIKLIERLCGRGDLYKQKLLVLVLIFIGTIIGFYIKK